MAGSQFVDVAKFTAVSAGTGSFVVSAAVSGYQTPATAGAITATQYSYRSESADLTQWEVGQGTYTSSNVTLTRTPLFNSAGGSSAINFTLPPQVGLVLLAEDVLPLVKVNPLTASTTVDILLSNTATYFDGPSVSQGTSGTFFASGSVTVTDTGVASVTAKLWDGTTVIDSGQTTLTIANARAVISLSGYLTSPASNIKISCKDVGSSNGKILFNQTGESKDSTVTVFRIG